MVTSLKGAVSQSEHQFRWSAVCVNRPHAFPSIFDFDFVGLGCGILILSMNIFNFPLVQRRF